MDQELELPSWQWYGTGVGGHPTPWCLQHHVRSLEDHEDVSFECAMSHLYDPVVVVHPTAYRRQHHAALLDDHSVSHSERPMWQSCGALVVVAGRRGLALVVLLLLMLVLLLPPVPRVVLNVEVEDDELVVEHPRPA